MKKLLFILVTITSITFANIRCNDDVGYASILQNYLEIQKALNQEDITEKEQAKLIKKQEEIENKIQEIEKQLLGQNQSTNSILQNLPTNELLEKHNKIIQNTEFEKLIRQESFEDLLQEYKKIVEKFFLSEKFSLPFVSSLFTQIITLHIKKQELKNEKHKELFTQMLFILSHVKNKINLNQIIKRSFGPTAMQLLKDGSYFLVIKTIKLIPTLTIHVITTMFKNSTKCIINLVKKPFTVKKVSA